MMVFTLARASVDGALLVVAIWAAICLLDRVLFLSPATRAMLWWCAAAKFVVALTWTTPVNIPILPAQPAVRRVVGGASPRTEQFSLGSNRAAQAQRPATGGWNGALREWSTFAAVGWTMGLLIVGAVGVRRWRDTVRLRDASSPANGALQAHAVELASHLRLKRVPEVRVSPGVDTPLVTGLLRPVVLLPANRFEALTDREQQMAICHELAHVKRADLWLGCVPALAERLFFFHPLVRLAAREYALSREAACDSAVMDTLEVAPQDYGRLLLALGVSRPRTGLTAAGAAWSFPNLKRRIAMLQNPSPRSTRSRALAVAVVGLAVAAMVPMQLAARRGSEIKPVQAAAQPKPAAAARSVPAPGTGRVRAHDAGRTPAVGRPGGAEGWRTELRPAARGQPADDVRVARRRCARPEASDER